MENKIGNKPFYQSRHSVFLHPFSLFFLLLPAHLLVFLPLAFFILFSSSSTIITSSSGETDRSLCFRYCYTSNDDDGTGRLFLHHHYYSWFIINAWLRWIRIEKKNLIKKRNVLGNECLTLPSHNRYLLPKWSVSPF